MPSSLLSPNRQRAGVSFNLLGIPIKVDVSFFVLSGFLAISRRSLPAVFLIEWVIVVFLSILIHELGHAMVGRRFGLVPSIELYSMGGLTFFPDGREVTPPKSIAISAAGPAAGFLMGSAVYLFSFKYGPGTSLLARTIITDLLWVNIGWGLVNLLPVWPLDGGNIARSAEGWITRKPGRLISNLLSVIVGAAVAAWSIANGQRWIFALMGYFVYLNGRELYSSFGKHSDGDLREPIERAWTFHEAGDAESAFLIAQRVYKSARLNEAKAEALGVMALAYLQGGRRAEATLEMKRLHACYGAEPYRRLVDSGNLARAVALLFAGFELTREDWVGQMLADGLIEATRYEEAMAVSVAPELTASAPSLLATIELRAFQAGAYELSARAGAASFERGGPPEVAYNVACALAHTSRSDEAMQWLSRALEAGFSDQQLLRTDPDLDSLRARPDFGLLLTKDKAPPLESLT